MDPPEQALKGEGETPPGECRQLVALGADACLAKHTEARDVLHAIHLASRGLQVLPAATLTAHKVRRSGPDLLTPREAEVLVLLQRGGSNAKIALKLNVGIETVRTRASGLPQGGGQDATGAAGDIRPRVISS